MDETRKNPRLNHGSLHVIPSERAVPRRLPVEPNSVVFISSLFADSEITFIDKNPFVDQDHPYTIIRGSIRFLTVKNEVENQDYEYDLVCSNMSNEFNGVKFPDVELENEYPEKGKSKPGVAGPAIIIRGGM